MTRRDIPALHLLLAFEAAARTMSFKAAARELAVTPSAVSQRIRNLEDQIGVRLFDRVNRGIILTTAGAAFQAEVQRILAELSVVAARVRDPETQVFTVAMNTIVAHEMVIPRLATFAKRVPGGRIDVRTRNSMKTFAPHDAEDFEIDAGIQISAGPWPGFEHRIIGPLTLVPVCSPKLAARIRDWDDLHRQTLYCARSRQAETLEALKHPETGRYQESVTTFETLLEVVRAVEAGYGVMLGLMPVMTSFVLQGRLAVAIEAECPSPEKLVFLVPKDRANRAGIEDVFEWVLEIYRKLPRLPIALTPPTVGA